jgi:hypothetical protein
MREKDDRDLARPRRLREGSTASGTAARDCGGSTACKSALFNKSYVLTII